MEDKTEEEIVICEGWRTEEEVAVCIIGGM